MKIDLGFQCKPVMALVGVDCFARKTSGLSLMCYKAYQDAIRIEQSIERHRMAALNMAKVNILMATFLPSAVSELLE